jgi:cytochrome c-type biogenesis protein CcmE
MSTRVKLWSAIVLVALVIIGLVVMGVARASSYYLTVNQTFQEHPKSGEVVTVSGKITPNSVVWNSSTLYLQFAIQDQVGGRSLTVAYHGLRPSDFANGWPVIVTGTVESNGVLKASNLLIKCPSKYTAKN